MKIRKKHPEPKVSIIEVARSMGVEMPKKTSWSIGSAIADAYLQETKERPETPLKRKTSGSGSHCIAVYPLSWVPRIMKAIEQAGAEEAKQPSLF